MSFRVDLDIFRGPLDLLLYLVRKHELDVVDISIAQVTEQYLDYLEVLKELDVNAVGDFLDMASTLIEIKSRILLPQQEEALEELEDPRDDLVQRLLEYKQYKDAASILEEQGRNWQQRYGRLANDLPPRRTAPGDQPIQEAELWDLVSAFGRLVRQQTTGNESSITYDETPIQNYMTSIHQRIVRDGRTCFSEMFEPGMHKSSMIGVFLAVLELVRHHSVITEQADAHGEIWIVPGEAFDAKANLESLPDSDYGGVPPVMPK